MGNQAPWSTTGSINQGLHVDEADAASCTAREGLNARIAYNNMADAYGGNALAHESRRSRTRSASRATTCSATSARART